VHEIRKYKFYDITCFGRLICRAPISLQVRGVGGDRDRSRDSSKEQSLSGSDTGTCKHP